MPCCSRREHPHPWIIAGWRDKIRLDLLSPVVPVATTFKEYSASAVVETRVRFFSELGR